MASRTLRLLAPLASASVLALALGACGDENTPGQSSGDIVQEDCVATFRVLQKDAYKDTAGRTSELWPPHTTTQLDLECDGQLVRTTHQANHGTRPGQVDANGDVFLVEVASYTVDGGRKQLGNLLDAFESCDCDGDTEFLSLDSVQDQVAADLLQTVATYLDANLLCEGSGTAELIGALQSGDVASALAVLPSCGWADGSSFDEGLDTAFRELLAATGELLVDYHVCNNDAVVQKALFDRFAQTGQLACDTGDLCRGPLWFYTPEQSGNGSAD